MSTVSIGVLAIALSEARKAGAKIPKIKSKKGK